MPTVSDAIQSKFEIGQVVNIVGVVTAIGGTTVEPTVTIQTKYAGFDGNKDTVGPVDATQVIVDK